MLFRLAGKCLVVRCQDEVVEGLPPKEMGVGIPKAAEIVSHDVQAQGPMNRRMKITPMVCCWDAARRLLWSDLFLCHSEAAAAGVLSCLFRSIGPVVSRRLCLMLANRYCGGYDRQLGEEFHGVWSYS